MPGKDGTGPLGKGPVQGQGTGRGAGGGMGVSLTGICRMGRRGAGTRGECECPQCGTRAPHTRGVPCFEQVCPQCGAKMVRAS